MKAILINPGESPKVVEVDGALESMQALVGGMLEHLPFTAGSVAYIDEEAKLKDPPPAVNTIAARIFGEIGPGLFPGDCIRGPMLIMGTLDEHGDYDGLEHDAPDDVVERVMNFERIRDAFE